MMLKMLKNFIIKNRRRHPSNGDVFYYEKIIHIFRNLLWHLGMYAITLGEKYG